MYTVKILPAALRALKKLDQTTRRRLGAAIDDLREQPRPHGVKKLEGVEGLYRVRVGEHRIVYQIDDAELIVTVVTLGNRRDVYR